MRKVSLIFPLLVLVAGISGCIIAEAKKADEESKKFVDEIVPKICANLTKENLFLYSVDELKTNTDQEETDRIFKIYNRLGKFKTLVKSKGSATINYDENGKSVVAEYISEALFQNGAAKISTKLIKKNEEWRIYNFNISSNVFIVEE